MARLTSDPNDPDIKRGAPDTEPVRQAAAYLVLSDEERAKGFVRPLRSSYVHVGRPGGKGCGTVTTMKGDGLIETYARDPGFYGGTYCVGCSMHLPVGEDGEFVWEGTEERVGT